MNKHLKLYNICFLLILFQLLIIYDVIAQQSEASLYKVLTLTGKKTANRDLPQDNGVAGTWQKLLKLQTTASVLHTQAHPDDEHADLLTYLSRGKGARTALLSLNRGESGGNIVGVEFFDELGLLRTEEFLLAASYYGLDDLYFTKLVDYGFSKRVEEAYEKWGRQNVLAVPDQMAPFPALLPGNSEEVSEEDSPIKLLALQHKVLNYPNKITPKDFENWVEQRGSKFFASWDTAYVPIISTHDLGQSAQSGGWLMARYGKGSYTYCAYSFHRQLPYAVDGAYRIMANLISYGKKQQ